MAYSVSEGNERQVAKAMIAKQRRHGMSSAGLLVLCVVLGLYLLGHGAQKLFGWFGGSGLAKTAASSCR
jgi:uncharacterized membrane protein YphA (DoxX/SURF4 family)